MLFGLNVQANHVRIVGNAATLGFSLALFHTQQTQVFKALSMSNDLLLAQADKMRNLSG
jgi:hypothetical protein